jgi:hypothetical protein
MAYRVSELLHRQPQRSCICSIGITPGMLFKLALENLVYALLCFG